MHTEWVSRSEWCLQRPSISSTLAGNTVIPHTCRVGKFTSAFSLEIPCMVLLTTLNSPKLRTHIGLQCTVHILHIYSTLGSSHNLRYRASHTWSACCEAITQQSPQTDIKLLPAGSVCIFRPDSCAKKFKYFSSLEFLRELYLSSFSFLI